MENKKTIRGLENKTIRFMELGASDPLPYTLCHTAQTQSQNSQRNTLRQRRLRWEWVKDDKAGQQAKSPVQAVMSSGEGASQAPGLKEKN